MKTIPVTRYKCEICNTVYDTEEGAKLCEEWPMSQDKGAKVGDTIKITRGDGTGQLAKVTKRFIFNREWGHYAWKRYWHTVGLCADVLDGYGSRILTFDNYETV